MNRLLKAAMMAGLISSAWSAHAAEFTLLIYESRGELTKRSDSGQASAYWGAYSAFAGEMAKAGVLRGGSALSETEQATVRGSAEAHDTAQRGTLGGYFVIDVPDLATARKWAAQAPPAAVAIEVRPHRVNPTMVAN